MRNQLDPSLTSLFVIPPHEANLMLPSRDVPYDSTLVFKAGVGRYQGWYLRVFRNNMVANGAVLSIGRCLGLVFVA